MKRHEALKILLESLKKNDLFISTTGLISREAFATKDRLGNFYMLGSMGLVSPVALGIALSRPRRKVVAVEGDGSLLLNLGILAIVGAEKPVNFLQIVLDNECYESTGGQSSISNRVTLAKLAQAAGYQNVFLVRSESKLKVAVKKGLKLKGPNFILVKIDSSRLEGVPRISLSPEEIKKRFISFANQ